MTSAEPASAASVPSGALHGVLFDMDGTLLDTEGLWRAAEEEVVGALGGLWTPEDQRATVGGSAHAAAAYIAELTGTRMTVAEIKRMLFAAMRRRLAAGAPLMPGAHRLLAQVRDAGLPTALVTSTYRSLLDVSITSIGAARFDTVVAGDEVANGKPHPEPYLTAARSLGADPARCVALEDSPTGVASAEAAGCVTVAVPHLVDIAPQPPRRLVVDTLTALDVEWLRAAMRQSDR